MGLEPQLSPVTPVLLQPSLAGSSLRQEKELGWGCQDGSTHVGQEVGAEFGGLQGAPGRGWEKPGALEPGLCRHTPALR